MNSERSTGWSGRRSGVAWRTRPTRRQFVEWVGAVVVLTGCGRFKKSEPAVPPVPATEAPATTDPPTTDPPATTRPPTTTSPATTTAPPPPPPTITISTPDGARFCQIYLGDPDPLACEQVPTAAVEIGGSVTPGAVVTVDNQAAQVDGDTWTARVPVEEGFTTITATASSAGGTATATVEIEYREMERSDW